MEATKSVEVLLTPTITRTILGSSNCCYSEVLNRLGTVHSKQNVARSFSHILFKNGVRVARDVGMETKSKSREGPFGMELIDQFESNVRTYSRKFPAVFEKAKDAYIYDATGKRYIDFLSG